MKSKHILAAALLSGALISCGHRTLSTVSGHADSRSVSVTRETVVDTTAFTRTLRAVLREPRIVIYRRTQSPDTPLATLSAEEIIIGDSLWLGQSRVSLRNDTIAESSSLSEQTQVSPSPDSQSHLRLIAAIVIAGLIVLSWRGTGFRR